VKTLVVLQPGYLPWLGFFDQMRRADVFVYYDDVQYDKHGWRNRNRVKSPGGPAWLTVPIRHHGLQQPSILDVEIDARAPWARKHLGTLRQYYSKAPYFKRYLPELEELLQRPWDRIVDLDLAVVGLMAGWLGIAPEIHRSSMLGVHGERSKRLVELSRHFGATRYLSGAAARDYLEVGLFDEHGIAVAWQDYQHPVYPQQHGDFVPYLSALDLVLNCGDDSRFILESGNL
jgi:WbqC-like protein family